MRIRRICVTAGIILALMTSAAFASEGSCCRPSEEQIKKYKADGTWEQRVEYMKGIEEGRNTGALIQRALSSNGEPSKAMLRALPTRWQGMPTEGEAAILAVRVEFADIKFEDSKNYSEAQLMSLITGNSTNELFPEAFGEYNQQYRSLSGYYERSSYGKLDLTCNDEAYTYTLSKDRDFYYNYATGEQELIKEVLTGLDEQIDYKDYDLDENGMIDGLLINFAGENEGWGGTWWSHAYKYDNENYGGEWDGVTGGNYLFLETYEFNRDLGHRTLIHETGHMIGLPDYYHATDSEKGILTTDMMNNNTGDHNGFSKLLLGWIDGDQIVDIDKQSAGETGQTVNLAPLSTAAPAEDDKLIAIIAPTKPGSIYDEYFLVEYDQEGVGNHGVASSTGHRIFHIDAELDEVGYDFAYYNMYSNGHDLIHAKRHEEDFGWMEEYYREGDEFTPQSSDSSAFYGGGIMGFTGIAIKEFAAASGSAPASFEVAFEEKEAVDGKLSITADRDIITNKGEIVLRNDHELFVEDHPEYGPHYVNGYYEDRVGNKHEAIIEFEQFEDPYVITVTGVKKDGSLKQNTEYELVIPEGEFQLDVDVFSEECRIPVKTANFPAIAKEYKYEDDPYIETVGNIFTIDEDTAGLLELRQKNDWWYMTLRAYEGLEEITHDEISIELPDDGYIFVQSIEGVSCYDGNIAVAIRYSLSMEGDPKTVIYKISPTGEVLTGKPYEIEGIIKMFPAGKGIKAISGEDGAVGVYDEELQDGVLDIPEDAKAVIYTIDFKNKMQTRKINDYAEFITLYPLDESSYAACSPWEGKINIYDLKDNSIKTISAPVDDVTYIYSVLKKGNDLIVVHASDNMANADYNGNEKLYVSIFNKNGKLVKSKKLLEYPQTDEYRNWSMEKAKWGFLLKGANDLSTVNFFIDKDFNMTKLLSMDTPYSAPNGNRLAFMKYGEDGRATAITGPINADGSGNSGTADIDGPRDGKDSNASTGDDAKLMLVMMLMLLSIGAGAYNIMHKRKKEN